MKKILILLILSLCIPCATWAKKGPEKEYEKLIKKYDIDSLAKGASSIDEFWAYSRNHNERFARYFKDYQKGTRDAKKANENLGLAFATAEPYISSLPYVSPESLDNLQAYLMDDLGVSRGFPDTRIYFVNEYNQINAFSYPDGMICIETSMLSMDDLSYYGLLGICAHEFAHYVLQHALVRQFEAIKNKRKNMIIAGVAAAVEVGAAFYGAMNGVNPDGLGDDLTSLFVGAELDSEKFRFKYSREQEVEADIIAFRFLDFIGVGGEYYVQALELVDKYTDDYYYSEESDHPATQFRIGLLKYMREHPEIEVRIPKNIIE